MSRLAAIRKQHERKTSGNFSDRHYFVNFDALKGAGPNGQDIKTYRAKQGQNFILILPPHDADAYFGQEIFVHRNIGPNNDAFLCPQRMRDLTCPICETWQELRNEGVDYEELRELSCLPPRWLFWIVDMTSEETMALGPQLFETCQTVNDEILGLCIDPRSGEEFDLSDPEERVDVAFWRQGESLNTRYSRFKLEERQVWDNSWLEFPTFDDVLVFAEYETINESFGGKSVPQGSDEESTTARRPSPDVEGRDGVAERRSDAAEDENAVDVERERSSRAPSRESFRKPSRAPKDKTGRRLGSFDEAAEDAPGDDGSESDTSGSRSPVVDRIRKRINSDD